MISFELSERARVMQEMTRGAAEQMMRPISRWCDENEHEKNWDYLNTMWEVSKGTTMVGGSDKDKDKGEKAGPNERVFDMFVTLPDGNEVQMFHYVYTRQS